MEFPRMPDKIIDIDIDPYMEHCARDGVVVSCSRGRTYLLIGELINFESYMETRRRHLFYYCLVGAILMLG